MFAACFASVYLAVQLVLVVLGGPYGPREDP